MTQAVPAGRMEMNPQSGHLPLTSWGSFCLSETSLLLKIADTNRPTIILVLFVWMYTSPFKIDIYFFILEITQLRVFHTLAVGFYVSFTLYLLVFMLLHRGF